MARRVQFGTTWWGKQWIDALTHLDYENRLPRGRTYYNTGRIDDMQFNPASSGSRRLRMAAPTRPTRLRLT